MVLDLGLADEMSPLRPCGVVRSFSYEPPVDGPVTVTLLGSVGIEVQAPAGEQHIIWGRLVKSDRSAVIAGRAGKGTIASR